MKGLKIFTHSVAMVFNNFSMALRISAVLYLVTIGLTVLVGLGFVFDQRALSSVIRAGTMPWGKLILVLFVSVLGALWTAVGWHRYVLRNEVPTGLVPIFRGDRIFAYLGRSVQTTLIISLVGALVGVAAGVLGAVVSKGGAPMLVGTPAFPLIIVVVSLFLFYRFAAVLPAAALGEPLGVGEAWGKTSGNWAAFLVLALVSGAATVALKLPVLFLSGPVAVLVWVVISGWVQAMVGVSIMTTIYGYFVEGRELR